mgnify:FL=1
MRRVRRTKKSGLLQSPLFSMVISLLLVAAAVGFVFGFGAFLKHQTYTGPEVASGLESTEEKEESPEYLDIDNSFQPCYVMICEVPPLGLWANPIPGEKTDASTMLVSGQIVHAKQRGTYKGETYYKLDDGSYLSAGISHAQPLLDYTEMEGYLAITYISSSGVRLRKWADFDADNVVGAVYVGDKVQIKAKVQTEKGDSAYITTDGLYITTDAQYFNDYTSVPEKSSDSKTGTESGESGSRADFSQKEGTEDKESTEDKSEKTKSTRSAGTTASGSSKNTERNEKVSEKSTADSGQTDSRETLNPGKWDFSDKELNQQE